MLILTMKQETYKSGSASCGKLLVSRLNTSVVSESTLILKDQRVTQG